MRWTFDFSYAIMENVYIEPTKIMKKAGRNDPCPCGSGKKFKKCCESKMIRGRFSATPVTQESAQQIQKAAGLTSLFQASIIPPVRKPPEAIEEPAPLSPVESTPPHTELEENGKSLISS